MKKQSDGTIIFENEEEYRNDRDNELRQRIRKEQEYEAAIPRLTAKENKTPFQMHIKKLLENAKLPTESNNETNETFLLQAALLMPTDYMKYPSEMTERFEAWRSLRPNDQMYHLLGEMNLSEQTQAEIENDPKKREEVWNRHREFEKEELDYLMSLEEIEDVWMELASLTEYAIEFDPTILA